MLSENKRRKYSPIDPYMKQSIGKDITDMRYDETENEDLQIHDYSQFDYEKFRDKRRYLPGSYQDNTDPLDPEDEPETESDPILRQSEPDVKDGFLGPLYVITGFFATMLIIGPLLVRKGPNRGIVQSSIMLTAFCMWIFWFTIYFGQMNPLMGPRLENTTVAWIAYKLGHHVGKHVSK